jgi:hypothetical protein
VSTKNKNSLIITAILILASFILHSYYSMANSVFTVSTSATISEGIVYIQNTNQAKSTITINAQVLENGSDFTGEVSYWEVSIWRINESGQPIHSGFQETVKIQETSPMFEYQRDIYTSVDFLNGEQQKRQRFAYRVMVYVKQDKGYESSGLLEQDVNDLESIISLVNIDSGSVDGINASSNLESSISLVNIDSGSVDGINASSNLESSISLVNIDSGSVDGINASSNLESSISLENIDSNSVDGMTNYNSVDLEITIYQP